MRMNRIIGKALNKTAVHAYKCDLLYGAALSLAERRGTQLPSHEKAVEILQAASPMPEGGLRVEPRKWPEKPTVDVSVIVPCYNVERFVEECVRSITEQETSRSFEVICVDDGAADGTGAILDRIAAAEASVRVIHQSNRGFSGARNTGIAEACGGGLSLSTLTTGCCPVPSRLCATRTTRAVATSSRRLTRISPRTA